MERPDDIYRGNYLDVDQSSFNPWDTGIGWRFWPKRKGGKITFNDIRDELFDQGMDGDMAVVLIKVPNEFDPEPQEHVDVYDTHQAVQILAHWENLKLVDLHGKEITE